VAKALKTSLNLESTLIPGRGGIFEVRVHEKVVAKKTMFGFPSPEAVVKAVRKVL
jgi:selenoprotein W-related protein